MKHSTKSPTKAQRARFEKLRNLGCIACHMNAHQFARMLRQPEIHHLNLGGLAGQKRRGHDDTVPLCPWHHRSECVNGFSTAVMAQAFGPSLARESKAFRERYGTDDELLARVNLLIGEREAA